MAGISLPPWIARHGALIQFIFCVPIVGAGLPLFRRGLLAILRTGRATMDTLVALGAGAAFLFSVAESLRHPASGPAHGGGHLYYETAGMLIAFILLGRWLEAAARGKPRRPSASSSAGSPGPRSCARRGARRRCRWRRSSPATSSW